MTLPGEFFIENSKKQQHEKGGYEGIIVLVLIPVNLDFFVNILGRFFR